MNGLTRKLMTLALASALAAPVALLAAEITPAAPDSHHPANEQPAVVSAPPAQPAQNSAAQLQERMQTRMRAMQQITDPQARMSMMMVQMQDMDEMMKGMNCPMAENMGGKAMMGGGGMKGHGMRTRMGGASSAAAMPGSPAK